VRERIATTTSTSTAKRRGTRLDDVEDMRFAMLLVLGGCVSHLGVGTRVVARLPSTIAAKASVSLTFDVQFYGVPLGGANDVVFVVDKSGSMDGRKLDTAKRQLVDVIDRLPDGTRIGVLFFDTTFWEWNDHELVALTSTNRKYAHTSST
jgi:hypothetical protein